jgi:hypothetical protein
MRMAYILCVCAALEVQLSEEVESTRCQLVRLAITQRLVSALKRLLHSLQHASLGRSVLRVHQSLIGNSGLQLVGQIQVVSCGHDVVEVDILDEWLHALSLSNLLVTHGLCGLSWVSVNACDKGMAELAVLGALIGCADNDSLATGESAVQHDNNLAWLDAAQ